MPGYQTSITVHAPVAAVWQVTRDVAAWPQWSPTMDDVAAPDGGPVTVGSTVRVRQPRLRPTTWVVDHVVEGRRFCWHTSGPGYHLVADHVLEALPDGTGVRLIMTMTGPLAWPVWLLGGRTIRSYVDQEAAALKRYCEANPA